MNSMAQQAVPKGIGQMEGLRPHLTAASRVVVMMSPPPWTPGYRVGSTILPLRMSRSPMARRIIDQSGAGGRGPFASLFFEHPGGHGPEVLDVGGLEGVQQAPPQLPGAEEQGGLVHQIAVAAVGQPVAPVSQG